jgi:molybdopterin-containing oxidoreductase family molybdopterin binding subunit
MDVNKTVRTTGALLPTRSLARRSFVKGAAAALALAGLSTTGFGCNATDGDDGDNKASADKTILNCCRGSCTMHCPIEATVRDGKLVRTTAARLSTIGRDDARICAKGSSWPNVVYAEKRIQYPMKRVGERGEDKWEQISWDEAISTIATRLSEIRDQFGGAAIAIGYEGGVLAPSGQGTYARWSGVMGASKLGCNDDQMSIQLMSLYAGGSPDYTDAKNIVMLGSTMPTSGPQNYRSIADAIVAGAKLTVVNPMFETSASKADLYLPIRPGTDGALAMAAINYIDANGLAAEEYLKTLTVAPFLVKKSDGMFLRQAVPADEQIEIDPVLVWDDAVDAAVLFTAAQQPALRGTFTVNGEEVSTAYQLLLDRVAAYTPDKAARLCDLSKEQVIAFAEACADNSAIAVGMGTDHYSNGLGTSHALLALRLQTGGLKLQESFSAPTVYWPLTGFGLDEEGHPAEAAIELSPFMALPLAKDGICELPGGGKPIEQPLKALLFMTGGRGSSWADHNRVIELFKTVDFFVACDINWGDNTKYADIVLPAASQFEIDDMEGTLNYLIYCEKAIEPLYDSKPDWEIGMLIAQAMGYDQWFADYKADSPLDIAIRGNQTLQMMQITATGLKAAKVIEIKEPNTPPAFYTATGRAVFYLEDPLPMKNYGQLFDREKIRLPYFQAPIEAWSVDIDEFPATEISRKYPLIYWTGSRRFRTHAAFNYAINMREVDLEPSVYINPADAAARGIEDGNYVKLFNDRGWLVARAVFHPGLRPGVVDMDRGWQSGQYIEPQSHYNNLTHVKMEPACYNHMLYDVVCEMENYKEEN